MQNKQKYINTMYPKSQFPVWSKARLYIYPYAFFFLQTSASDITFLFNDNQNEYGSEFFLLTSHSFPHP